MPERETLERAREDAREGKSPSTQAGEFVREEIHHVREGKHGVRSPQQAIAIGLSKARRAGVKLKPPKKASKETRKQAARDLKKGKKKAGKSKSNRERERAIALREKRVSEREIHVATQLEGLELKQHEFVKRHDELRSVEIHREFITAAAR